MKKIPITPLLNVDIAVFSPSYFQTENQLAGFAYYFLEYKTRGPTTMKKKLFVNLYQTCIAQPCRSSKNSLFWNGFFCLCVAPTGSIKLHKRYGILKINTAEYFVLLFEDIDDTTIFTS